MRPAFVLQEIFNGLRRNVTMAVAVVVTVMISLSFVGAAILATNVTKRMHDRYYGKFEVAIYLKTDISPQEQTALQQQIQSDPLVKGSFYVSRDQALINFKQLFADEPNLVDSVQDSSVLPASFQVSLRDPKRLDDIKAEYVSEPGVDSVNDPVKTLQPVFNLIDGVRTLGIVVAVVSGIAAILTTFNTIRLAAFSRRREIGIMRLVGASNITIQLPFVLEGVIAGLVGAMSAFGLLALFKRFLLDTSLRSFFETQVIPKVEWNDLWSITPYLLIAGVLVAAVASYVTSLVYVRV